MAGIERPDSEPEGFLATLRFVVWPDTKRFLDTQHKRTRNRRGLVPMCALGAIMTVPGLLILAVAVTLSSAFAAVVLGGTAILLFLLPGIYALIFATRIAMALRRFPQ